MLGEEALQLLTFDDLDGRSHEVLGQGVDKLLGRLPFGFAKCDLVHLETESRGMCNGHVDLRGS